MKRCKSGDITWFDLCQIQSCKMSIILHGAKPLNLNFTRRKGEKVQIWWHHLMWSVRSQPRLFDRFFFFNLFAHNVLSNWDLVRDVWGKDVGNEMIQFVSSFIWPRLRLAAAVSGKILWNDCHNLIRLLSFTLSLRLITKTHIKSIKDWTKRLKKHQRLNKTPPKSIK